MWTKIKSFMTFVWLLRVEVFMFFTAYSLYIRNLPLDLLIQDKICRNQYNLSVTFCHNLATVKENETGGHYKSDILSQAVQYNMYQNIIQYAPGIVWALFLGAWIDKYNNGRKAVFIIGSTTQCIEAVMNWFNAYYFESDVRWILLSFVPYVASGSMTWSTAYSYVAATTPDHLKAIRMLVLETVVALAHLAATVSYGQLINMRPLWSDQQIHNNALIFFISALSALLAFGWTMTVIDQDKDKNMFYSHFSQPNSQRIPDSIDDNDEDKYQKRGTRRHPLRLLFDLNNVKEVFVTSFKARPDRKRAQIWLVIGGIFTYLFVLVFVPSFEFQFVEKIYHWDAQQFSYWQSVGLAANCIFVLTLPPLLVKTFKVNDMVLAIIGFSGLMLRMVILGTVLSPTGYYISLVFSCTTWMADAGLRSHLSDSVDQTELGRIFTLLTIVDGVVPPIASTLSSHAFSATIDSTAPGLCYMIGAIVCLISLAIVSTIICLNRNTRVVEACD